MDIRSLIVPLSSTEEAAQKIYDWFSQDGVSFGYDGNSCVYRGGSDPNSGTRCAIGCLLPDELYKEAIFNDELREGDAASDAIHANLETEKFFANVSENFLCDAQNLHDHYASKESSAGTSQFLAEFVQLANNYGCVIYFSGGYNCPVAS